MSGLPSGVEEVEAIEGGEGGGNVEA